MNLTPLAIVAQSINEVIGSNIQTTPKDDWFELHFNDKSKDLPAYIVGSEWKPSRLTLEVGVSVGFDLSPLRNPEKVAKDLSRSVEPFVEGLYEASGNLTIWTYPEGSLTPAYVALIDYEPLEDEEIRRNVQSIFVRGTRMLGLLTPVFYMIERGYMPTAVERLESLMHEHALWEVNSVTSDVPQHGVRFPRRLFGGTQAPLSQ